MEPRHYFSTKYARTAAKLEEAEKTIEELLIVLDSILKSGDPSTEEWHIAFDVLAKHGRI